jgi:cytochrome c oxidase accessory protein FixG
MIDPRGLRPLPTGDAREAPLPRSERVPRFGPWRRIAAALQAAAWLGLPFARVGGESALRLDVPAGRLHAFGASFAIDEAFVVLAATLALTFGFLLVTLAAGRVWCGWACPQTVLSDLTAWVAPERRARPRRWRRPLGFAAVAAASVAVSATLLWYFVTPQEFLARLAAGRLGPVLGGSWAVLAGILFADLAFLRQRFCTGVCPYAKLQGVLFDRATLVVAYDARRAADCVDCGACVRVCPTGIDIRDGLQAECIACAACIDACEPIMARLRRPPHLVGYFAGGPGAAAGAGVRRWLRPGLVALALATLASLAAVVGAVAGRGAIALTAASAAAFAPRRAGVGRAVNELEVALANRGHEPVVVALGARAGGGAVALRPAQVTLAPGERRQVRVLAILSGLPAGRTAGELRAEAREGGRLVDQRAAAVSFVVPEAGPGPSPAEPP